MNLNLVYDLDTQPFSVGDMLTHHSAALCVRERMGHSLIDTTILHSGRYSSGGIELDRDIKWLIETARFNRYGGTVTVAKKGHHISSDPWPGKDHYTTYQCWELMTEFWEKHGWFPVLEPRLELQELAAKSGGTTTIQVRRNPANPGRNSDYGEWSRFLGNHRNENFIVIASKRERDRSLECFGNMTYAPDAMDQSLALIWAADLHLGMASGPAQIRWYLPKPFCIFKEPVDIKRVKGMRLEDGAKKMVWMGEDQRLLPDADKVESIEREYERMKHALARNRGDRAAGVGDSGHTLAQRGLDYRLVHENQLPRICPSLPG